MKKYLFLFTLLTFISIPVLAAEKTDGCNCPNPKDQLCKQAVVIRDDIANSISTLTAQGPAWIRCSMLKKTSLRFKAHETYLLDYRYKHEKSNPDDKTSTGYISALVGNIGGLRGGCQPGETDETKLEAGLSTLRKMAEDASLDLVATVTVNCGADYATVFTQPQNIKSTNVYNGKEAKDISNQQNSVKLDSEKKAQKAN